MYLLKRIWPLFLLTVFLATFAFFFNSINEKNLVAKRMVKIFTNFVNPKQANLEVQYSQETIGSVSSITPSPSPSPQPSKAPLPVDPYVNDPDLKDAEWGKAVQVSETGYKMKIGFDSTMATPQETFQALNLYRYTKGKSNLTWDDRLAKYGLERATFVCKNGSDGHAGFSDYVQNQEGYKTLGFYNLGENMSTHMKFTGTHLIEWMYAGDAAHDGNQLGNWSHVGVGIYEDCSSLIFGNNMI
jgi:uncharacterized protein YkwD